ncbi:SMC family ATPase [Micrococcus sp. 2A]|uniref:AAA family ATPase n=1 Tax=Micrococcus sp. 2A TaxID=3142261 RepID=UPI00260F0226|nr:SMC family ATPase [uncultured Micrococcus sp.]
MRIHRMRLQGLGPYADRQDVDFAALNAAGLFLLDGPTGAGKSTILAALCYALYGSVPGGRLPESLVTTLREPGAVTPEVLLEFSVQGRRFEVLRSPKHLRKKKKGDGLTSTQAAVSLREHAEGEWGAPLTRADEVGQLIASVMHLDADQFMQVVLLPQGQFAQFLTATSDDRRALLRRLFGTQRFDGVEEHLKGEASRLDGAVAADAAIADAARAQLRDAMREELGEGWPAPEPHPETDEGLLDLAVRRADAAREAAGAGLTAAHTAERDARAAVRALESTAASLAAAAGWTDRLSVHEASARETGEGRAAVLAHERAGRVLAAAARARRAEHAEHAEGERAATAAAGVAAEPLAASWLGEASGEGEQDEVAGATVSVARTALQRADRAADAVEAAVKDRARMARLEEEQAAGGARREAIEGERAAGAHEREARSTAIVAVREAVESGGARLGARAAVDRRAEEARTRRAAAGLAEERRAAAERARADHERLVARERAAAEKHVGLLRSRYEQAASELSEQLVEGEPCAVCGSPAHPRPAPAAATTVTEADVAAAEKARDRAGAAAAQAEAARERAESALREARDAAGGLGVEEAEAALGAAEAEQADLAAVAKALAADRRTLTKLETAQTAAESADAALALEAERLEEATARRAERLLELRAAVEAAQADAEDLDVRRGQVGGARRALRALADAAEAQARAAAVRAETAEALAAALAAEDFTGAEAAAQARLDDDDASALTARVRAWDEEGSRLAELGTTELVAEGRALAEAGTAAPTQEESAAAAERLAAAEAASAERATAVGRLDTLVATVRRQSAALTDVLGRSAALIEEHRTVTQLLALVRGGGENRLKMPLTSYVLAGRLEEVAAAATERLLAMTDARYSIEYSDAVGGRGNKGLELVVRDHYVDETRHPSTLSGGETFMASLALALGLADTVQAESGGIELDTLFVDEGFGSLDSETLDDVLDVVDSLRSGGRTVGLVSHVDRMKQEIGVRLEVRKDRRGSSLAVHEGT